MVEAKLVRGFKEHDRPAIVALLREYEAGVGISLCFQDFAGELADLPGAYAPPGGQMLFAADPEGGGLLGCVAIRPVTGSPELCEMKRLFVREAGRGTGLGRKLALAAMDEARRLGYAAMCLDTLPHMTAAQALYRNLGFRQTGVTTSEPSVLLFQRALEAAA